MSGTRIKKGAVIDKSIIAENCVIGENTKLGVGDYAESKLSTKVYAFDLVTIGENTIVPDNVTIGKNTALKGTTNPADYPGGALESGGYIIKAGEGA